MEGFANEEIFQDFIVRYLTTQPILDADGKPTSEMEYHEIPAAEYNKPENKDTEAVFRQELTGNDIK